MRRIRHCFAVLAGILLWLAGGAFVGEAIAAEEFAPHRTLGDIRVVAVRLSGAHGDWRRYGFSETAILEAVTRRLTQQGIRVVGPAESLSMPEALILSIELHVNDATFFDSFLVFLKLKEKIPMPDNPEGFVTHDIWSKWRIGSFRKDEYTKLQGHVLDLLEKLLSSYHLSP